MHQPDRETSETPRPLIEPETKLKAVPHAAGYSFPMADIDRMLAEIERGYQG